MHEDNNNLSIALKEKINDNEKLKNRSTILEKDFIGKKLFKYYFKDI